MIRLMKADTPQIIRERGEEWRQAYETAVAAGRLDDPVRYCYRDPEIKSALRREAHEKCIYCETKLSEGTTDHIEPVSKRPDRLVDWQNLGFACQECNRFKGSYYAPSQPLLNPFVDEPGDELTVFGPMILARLGKRKGERTVIRLRLSRPSLVQRRAERVKAVSQLAARWQAEADGPTKDLLWEAIALEAEDASEYAAVVREYLAQEVGLGLNSGRWSDESPQATAPTPPVRRT